MAMRSNSSPGVNPEPEVTAEPSAEAEPEGEPGGKATAAEITLPPISIILLVLIGILILSLVTQSRWWRWILRRTSSKTAHAHNKLNNSHVREVKTLFTGVERVNKVSHDSSPSPPTLLTPHDHVILGEFSRFQNQPKDLLKIASPAITALAFCPLTLFMYGPLMEFFWPVKLFPQPPNINDVIACYLTPAGLVYAIAFGFAFEDAMNKKHRMTEKIKSILDHLYHMTIMSSRLPCISTSERLAVYTGLKDEAVDWMERVMRPHTGFKREVTMGHLWQVADALQSACRGRAAADATTLELHLVDELLDHLLDLDQLLADRMRQMQNFMSSLQWAFLEILGFLAFFGILLLRGESYRLELTICILTVFSISMFTYVLADFDAPLHGFFRVNLQPVAQFVYELEETYRQLVAQDKGETLQKGTA